MALQAGLRLGSRPPPSRQGCSLTGAAGRRGPWAPALPRAAPGLGGWALWVPVGGGEAAVPQGQICRLLPSTEA